MSTQRPMAVCSEDVALGCVATQDESSVLLSRLRELEPRLEVGRGGS